MELTQADLQKAIAGSSRRIELWPAILDRMQARSAAEIGVYRGRFSEAILRGCPGITRYTMVDPWRHLEDWNKPANKPDHAFEVIHRDAMERTEPWADKRVVLRGTTTEVVEEIPDGSLDFAYLDGDHTLRGVTIDLHRLFPKVRDGGWLGGDDFRRTIWQHDERFEPSLVFPYAVFFAEAAGTTIYALPHGQFLMRKASGEPFAFVDLTGKYESVDLHAYLSQELARPGSGDDS